MFTIEDLSTKPAKDFFEKFASKGKVNLVSNPEVTNDPLVFANRIAMSYLYLFCTLDGIQSSSGVEDCSNKLIGAMLLATSIPKITTLTADNDYPDDFVAEGQGIAYEIMGLSAFLKSKGAGVILPRVRGDGLYTPSVLLGYISMVSAETIYVHGGKLESTSPDLYQLVKSRIMGLWIQVIEYTYKLLDVGKCLGTVFVIPDIVCQATTYLTDTAAENIGKRLYWNIPYWNTGSAVDGESEESTTNLEPAIRVSLASEPKGLKITILTGVCEKMTPYKKLLGVSMRNYAEISNVNSTTLYSFDFDNNAFVHWLRGTNPAEYSAWRLDLMFQGKQKGLTPSSYALQLLGKDTKTWDQYSRQEALRKTAFMVINNNIPGVEIDPVMLDQIDKFRQDFEESAKIITVRDMIADESELPVFTRRLRSLINIYVQPKEVMPLMKNHLGGATSAFKGVIDPEIAGTLIIGIPECMSAIKDAFSPGVSTRDILHIENLSPATNKEIFIRSILELLKESTFGSLQVTSARGALDRIQEFVLLSDFVFSPISIPVGDALILKEDAPIRNPQTEEDLVTGDAEKFVYNLIKSGASIPDILERSMVCMQETIATSLGYIRGLYSGDITIISEQDLLDPLSKFVHSLNVLVEASAVVHRLLNHQWSKAYTLWIKHFEARGNNDIGYILPMDRLRDLSLYSTGCDSALECRVGAITFKGLNKDFATKVYSMLLAPVEPAVRLGVFTRFFKEAAGYPATDLLLITKGSNSYVSRIIKVFKALLHEAAHEALAYTFSPKQYTVNQEEFQEFCYLQGVLKREVFAHGTVSLAGLRDYNRARFAQVVHITSPVSMTLLDKYAIFLG